MELPIKVYLLPAKLGHSLITPSLYVHLKTLEDQNLF